MRTPEQIKEFVFINHHLMTNHEMADELGLSYEWVTMLCADMGLKAFKPRDKYVEFIKNCKDLTIEDCVEILGVTSEYIRKLNLELGEPLISRKKKELLDRKAAEANIPESKNYFTKQEEDIYMEILLQIVEGMESKDKQRFAKRYMIEKQIPEMEMRYEV
jgi:hypothetical protein